ncbi:chemotaxis signal transduction protein [Thermanaerovibrio velox DSM 12556]|uniref:Chemotaxis signal transduction protein n=1 Tax=Thermanaerovibrio velox DSM 12556 TaxID=926567 RepID=H0UP48_9BACT|nr:chemotaxis protein CheW [Thermanaerovibrio velox]EHM10551.1 chemotaxis signal transduction protein [Thermanaerovibrio velox DSM 12556]
MDSFLVMRIASRYLALPIQQVVRAVPAALLSPPAGKGPVAGILNLEGEMIPVIDPREIFGVPKKEMDTSDAIVLAQWGDQVIGIWVDQVLGVFEPQSRRSCTVMGQPVDAVAIGQDQPVAAVLDIGGMFSER